MSTNPIKSLKKALSHQQYYNLFAYICVILIQKCVHNNEKNLFF